MSRRRHVETTGGNVIPSFGITSRKVRLAGSGTGQRTPAGCGKPGHVLIIERLGPVPRFPTSPSPELAEGGRERSLTMARLRKQGVATMKAASHRPLFQRIG